MKFKYLIIFCILLTSCQFFNATKVNNESQLDTIVDFSKVDASPSFTECKDKIDNERLTCFRTTIHQKLSENLATHSIKVKDSIDEIVKIHLLIDSKGNISLKEIFSSDEVKKQIKNIDSLLKVSVGSLPQVLPALKRSIPVTTQYELPIRILFKK